MIKGTKYSAHLFLHAIFGEEVTKEKKDNLPETNSSPMKNPPPFLGFIPLKCWIFMGYVLLVYQRVSFFGGRWPVASGSLGVEPVFSPKKTFKKCTLQKK